MCRRIRYVLLGLLFFIIFSPKLAFASIQQPWNTVIYGPMSKTVDGQQIVEVGVCAFGRFDSAMVALGYDDAFIDDLSSDVRAKLSNQVTGGAFWAFAQNFELAPRDDWSLQGINWQSLTSLYGYGNVWRGVYSTGEAANAKRDLLTILQGGSVGGGGGGAIEGDYVVFKVPIARIYPSPGGPAAFNPVASGKYLTNILDQGKGDGSSSKSKLLLPNEILLRIPLASFSNTIADTDDYVITIKTASYGGVILYLYKIDDSSTDVSKTTHDYSTTYEDVSYSSTLNYISANNVVGFGYHTYTNTQYVYENGVFTFSNVWSIQQSNGRSSINYTYNSYNLPSTAYIGYLGSGGTPVVPPSNWPDAPEVVSPTAPEVPNPSDPVQTPQPAEPTSPTLPSFPLLTVQPDVSYDTPDLSAILDAMNEHCQHLQSAIYQGFADYFDTFTPWLDERLELLQECIRGESVWQIQRIDADFESLKDYLHDLFEWLADQMQFTFTADSYDDTSVISWLRRIYFKLQSSPVNTRPADPVANPDGAWDWLWQLLQDILTGLTGGATELVGKLMTLFDGIKDKFPFSVPWDLASVLVLLDVPAQTPAFTVSYDVFGTTVTYDIDLHFMDEYAGVIRSMETVLFCFMLIKNTKWVTGVFDEIGQFLGTKLGYRG